MRQERIALRSGDWQPLFLKLTARGITIPVAARLVGVEPREISREQRTSERFASDYQVAQLCGVAARAGHRLRPAFAVRIRDAAVCDHQEPLGLLSRLIRRAELVRAERHAGVSVRQPWHSRPMSDRHRRPADRYDTGNG